MSTLAESAGLLADMPGRVFKAFVGPMDEPQRNACIERRRGELERRKRLSKTATQILRAAKAEHRHCYPSEPRLEAAMRDEPLPGATCQGEECHDHAPWPSCYMVTVGQRPRRSRKRHYAESERLQVSWECWLESQSQHFLHALPSSSSIVRFG